jgi:thiosulfate dehydrogenase [quinone] large subunit
VRTTSRPPAALARRQPVQAARRAPADLALWPLRLFLGFTFTYAGLQKLANPAYLDARSHTSVQATMLSLRHQSPIGWLLGISAHAPVLVGVLIALGELSVGLATLLGLWTRLAAAGGMFLALTFFLTVSFHTHPYYYGSDIVFVFAWTVPLIAGAWPAPTVDDWIRRRAATEHDPQRRALVLGAGAAAGLAAFTGVLAGITAAIGRSLHDSAAPAAGGPGGAAPSPSATGGAGPAAPAAQGRALIAAADLPAGRAVQFTDNSGGPAWLLHEPSGEFRAFSAICTHAGCSVDISGGEFVCPCHGGTYSAQTGAVTGGPPPSPLAALKVQVVNGQVRLI